MITGQISSDQLRIRDLANETLGIWNGRGKFAED
jgi:hypothetical protein